MVTAVAFPAPATIFHGTDAPDEPALPPGPERPTTVLDIDIGRSLAYKGCMEFEWDDAKSDACFADLGFDFAYVAHAFLDEDRIVGVDRRWDYGEDRYRLLAAVEGRVFVVDLHHARRDDPHYFGPQGQPQGGSGI